MRRLNKSDPTFEADFNALIAAVREDDTNIRADVEHILEDVKRNGFDSVVSYTEKFDGFKLTAQSVAITSAEIDAAFARCDATLIEALEFAASRIRAYHERQLPADELYTDEAGVELGWRWTSVDAAGLYAPGGRAAYPSSVLMNAIPAKVAGVERLVMTTPTPDGVMNDAVLAAAKIAGIDENLPNRRRPGDWRT